MRSLETIAEKFVFFKWFLRNYFLRLFFTCLEMRTKPTLMAGLKKCPFWYGQFSAELLNIFAEKLVSKCSEEWSTKPMQVAACALEWVLPWNFCCQGESYSLREAVNQITCSFFTVVSRSHTLKDRLCPLGTGLLEIQHSVYCNKRVT